MSAEIARGLVGLGVCVRGEAGALGLGKSVGATENEAERGNH